MDRILKAERAPIGRRVAALVHQAAVRAREILAGAEEEARGARAAAALECERLRLGAVEDGRTEGLGRAAAILATAAVERDRRLRALDREVAALALEVAGRIVGRELSRDPAAVVDLAARALEQARDRREVTIRVSPADLGHVQRAEGRLAALLARAPGVTVQPDASIAAGGVVVETEAGRLDARVEAQLLALERALDEELR